MALEGTLRDFSFADILQLISLQRKTGVLTLTTTDDVATVSFLDGRIVGANSREHRVENRLGLLLLRSGKVSEEELDAALQRQEQSLQRLGRILIDHHVVEPEDVRDALTQQILQIIYRVFRWPDGDYHFSQESDIDYDGELIDPVAADSIIMEGARMMDEWPFIEQRLPDRQMVVVRTVPLESLELADDGDELDDLLGFAFRDPRDSMVDSARWLVDQGRA